MSRAKRVLSLLAAVMVVWLWGVPSALLAQGDAVIYVCVVPKTGIMYQVNPPGQPGLDDDLPDTCRTQRHSLLEWNQQGPPGADGIHCWDLDGDGVADPDEDTNGDGSVDVLDCKGPKGDRGEPGPPGEGFNLSCSAQEVAKWGGTGWVCATDDDTKYTAGVGLDLQGSTFHVNPLEAQRRVVQDCAPGSSIRVVREDGTVVCEPDDDTVYGAGSGLALDNGTFLIPSGGVSNSQLGADIALRGYEIVHETYTVPVAGSIGAGASGVATCPAGKRLLGGGFTGDAKTTTKIVHSFPTQLSPGEYSWYVAAVNWDTFQEFTFGVWAICAL